MTIVNLKIEGWLENVVDWYIKNGFATSKTEVLRMGLMKLGEDREKLGSFIAKNANSDIWKNKKEDKVWGKY